MDTEHVFVDRHSGQFVPVEQLHAGLYLQQQTMIDVQPVLDENGAVTGGSVTFWHEVVLMDEVYPPASLLDDTPSEIG